MSISFDSAGSLKEGTTKADTTNEEITNFDDNQDESTINKINIGR